MGHDAGADRRVRRGRVRLRVAPARQRPHRQRGRHRARGARRHRGDRPGLSRRLLAVARDVPAARPGRRPALVADQRRLLRRRRHDGHARRPAGRSRPGPRPRRRVRLAANRPRRDRRRSCRSSRRTCASRTGASRARSPTPRTRCCSSRPSSSAARSPSSPTSRRARSATVDVALAGRARWASSCRTRSSVRCSSGTRARSATDAARMYARHTIVDQLTFDPNMGFTGQLPADGPVILAWSDRELLPVEIEGAAPRRTGNVLWFLPTELVDQRHDARSATTCCARRSISSDAAFFSKDPFSINFGRGTAELAYRPIAFDGTLAGDRAGDRPQLRGPGLRRRPQAHRAAARDPATVRASGRPRTARCRTSTGCRRSSCST